MELTRTGRITTWHDDRGFGFITPNAGGARVFVHIKAFKDRSRRPAIHDLVTYTVTKDGQGRSQAQQATFSGRQAKVSRRFPEAMRPIAPALLFAAAGMLSTFLSLTPGLVLIYYLVISSLTFLIFGKDKSAASRNNWRTPESTLHMLALLGGWPGACFAQHLLRHKTKKSKFRAAYWTTVVANCSAFMWLHTKAGLSLLHSLLGA